jgi:hypothetical protein
VNSFIQNLLGFFRLTITRRSSTLLVLESLATLVPKKARVPLVRIGPNFDGGYVCPDDFFGINKAFSPGTNCVWEFERSLAEKYGIHSILLDSQDKMPVNLGALQTFRSAFLGPVNKPGYITLESWVAVDSTITDNNLLLQMDIEGDEYSVLLSTPTVTLKRFRIMVIEFHNLNWLLNLPLAANVIHPVFQKLSEDFEVLFVNPNNAGGEWRLGRYKFPRVLEVTFLRKDRISEGSNYLNHSYSHTFRNNPDKKNIKFDHDLILSLIKKIKTSS